MRDLYSDDYESVAGDSDERLIPDRLRRIAGAVVFVGLVTAMGFWSWRLGTRDAADVPIIRAMEGPTRVQPDDPGGEVAAHQGLEVNGVLAGAETPVSRVVVPAEAPPVLSSEDAPQGELVVAAPDFSSEAMRGPEAELQVPDADGEASEAETVELSPAATIEALVAAAQGEAAIAGPRPKVRPVNLVRASAKPAAKPAIEASRSAETTPIPAAAGLKEVSSVTPGSRVVQLGAYDSEAITRTAWSRLVAKNGDLLGGKSLYVERATSNARVFYRLRVAGFASADETRVMCEALRARGVDCIPVTLQ